MASAWKSQASWGLSISLVYNQSLSKWHGWPATPRPCSLSNIKSFFSYMIMVWSYSWCGCFQSSSHCLVLMCFIMFTFVIGDRFMILLDNHKILASWHGYRGRFGSEEMWFFFFFFFENSVQWYVLVIVQKIHCYSCLLRSISWISKSRILIQLRVLTSAHGLVLYS